MNGDISVIGGLKGKYLRVMEAWPCHRLVKGTWACVSSAVKWG